MNRLATASLITGLACLFGQAAGVAISKIGVWDRPAPLTTCELDEGNNKLLITLPFNKDTSRVIDITSRDGNIFKGVSNDNVEVTYIKGESGMDSCSGHAYRPQLGGMFQWSALNYNYSVK
jgi:hypothetical protein